MKKHFASIFVLTTVFNASAMLSRLAGQAGQIRTVSGLMQNLSSTSSAKSSGSEDSANTFVVDAGILTDAKQKYKSDNASYLIELYRKRDELNIDLLEATENKDFNTKLAVRSPLFVFPPFVIYVFCIALSERVDSIRRIDLVTKQIAFLDARIEAQKRDLQQEQIAAADSRVQVSNDK